MMGEITSGGTGVYSIRGGGGGEVGVDVGEAGATVSAELDWAVAFALKMQAERSKLNEPRKRIVRINERWVLRMKVRELILLCTVGLLVGIRHYP